MWAAAATCAGRCKMDKHSAACTTTRRAARGCTPSRACCCWAAVTALSTPRTTALAGAELVPATSSHKASAVRSYPLRSAVAGVGHELNGGIAQAGRPGNSPTGASGAGSSVQRSATRSGWGTAPGCRASPLTGLAGLALGLAAP